jgi:hypothetical protein
MTSRLRWRTLAALRVTHALATGFLLLAAAPAAFAQVSEASAPDQPRQGHPQMKPAPTQPRRTATARASPAPEPLSAEDAALVQEMALLERVDLLRNLDLFERSADERDSRDGAAPEDPKRQP